MKKTATFSKRKSRSSTKIASQLSYHRQEPTAMPWPQQSSPSPRACSAGTLWRQSDKIRTLHRASKTNSWYSIEASSACARRLSRCRSGGSMKKTTRKARSSSACSHKVGRRRNVVYWRTQNVPNLKWASSRSTQGTTNFVVEHLKFQRRSRSRKRKMMLFTVKRLSSNGLKNLGALI